MEEEDQDLTPFWLRSGGDTYFRRSNSSGRGRTTATLKIVFFSFLAFSFIFFIVPQFASTASQIFRPHLVRKGWDSLNLVLVLFAIICGFLSRNTENSSSSDSPSTSRSSYEFDFKPADPVRRPNQWYDNGDRYSDRTVVNRFSRTRSMRSSSSYPDLRGYETSWGGEDQRWRFSDDTRLYDHRFDRPEQLYQGYRRLPEAKAEEDLGGVAAGGGDGGDGDHALDKLEEKEIYTVKQVTPSAPPDPSPPRRSPSPPPRPPSPPPSPPPSWPPVSSYQSPSPPPVPPPPPICKPARRKTTKRVYQDLEPNTERVEKVDLKLETAIRPPPRSDLPQPPPRPALAYERSRKNEKKRGGATKEFLIALRRKKKKQRQKSVENIDILFESPSSSIPQLPPRTPPPPPPPPPPTFLHGLFSSKKGKSKRIQSTPPPPPPPPPRRSRSESLESRASTSKSQKAPMTWEKPKASSRVTAFSHADRITTIGNESPLHPIPPPPPPPPFKMPAWKYVVQGDYARLVSISRSASPDLDGEEDASDDGSHSPAPPFCPSPDVDTKADNFISRFRAGLKLEKMNSVKEKHRGGKSNLGPGPEPGPEPDTDPFEGEKESTGR